MYPVAVTMWLTQEQREKMVSLGGVRWFRKILDKAELPLGKPFYASIKERNTQICLDVRSAKLVARDYDVSPATVYRLRAEARNAGRPVAIFHSKGPPCPSSPPPSSSET